MYTVTGRIKKCNKLQYLTSPAFPYQALPVEDVMAASKSEFADWGKDDSQMNWGPVVDDYADLPFLPLPPLQVSDTCLPKCDITPTTVSSWHPFI